MISFCVEKTSGHARLGTLTTSHAQVRTPAFMPVGTQAAVKAVSSEEVAETGARMQIMNTYHLWLRPGPELVAELGGLHAFARWPHAIVTDSGGFQAFSLAQRMRASENGFEFASHLDGKKMLLSPEEAMRVQGLLGSDIAMQLDVCPPGGAPRTDLVQAVERTTRWAERCLAARAPGQGVFGIVQGGTDVELRLAHAETLAKLPFDGLALGGFSVGEPIPEMYRALALIGPSLPAERPRYLMGVGMPSDIVTAVMHGIDMFDCVIPTRNARNGQLFTWQGKIVIKNARYRDDPRPLEDGCACAACRGGYSRAYLRHLYLAGEILVLRLLSQHNLHFYARLMSELRSAIARDEFAAWSSEKMRLWQESAAES
ncbi:MAG TPA: tRNA guanosine(34) transglycosylase Tgt [Polyangiaceae bacterium]|nr:tRNA guanosine(34) transglycosylase Tgt [Polyangiaceae bacterium]